MEMTSFTYGLIISGIIVGLIVLIRWIIKHTNTVATLQKDVASMGEGIEHAHKYLDNRVESTVTQIKETESSLHDKIDSKVDDLHSRIDGEVNQIGSSIEEQARLLHDRVDEVQASIVKPKVKGK